MSGKFNNSGVRNSMWANEWIDDSSQFNQDAETVYETQSQISDLGDDQIGSGRWDVKDRMRKLFETQSFTDVTFYPKNTRKISISAHRAILAVGSPLFTKMLYGDQNNDTEGMKMEVKISNMSFDAFTNIVKYIYTDEVFFENDNLVLGILDGAKQFDIQSLVDRCKQYFESVDLSEQNVCSKLQMSISNKIDILKERCIEFIQKNTLRVINSADFLNCSSSTLRMICKLQSLNIRSEAELLESIMTWIYDQPPQNRKQLLEPLLKCIRFLTFSAREMGEVLKKYSSLLTANEGLKIILYLQNPKTSDIKELPAWCNKSTMSRCFYTANPNEIDVANMNDALPGKVFFPLSPSIEQKTVTELTSLLQMKCIRGKFRIHAIKLTFQKPISGNCVINKLTINVHCHSSGFRTYEKVHIINSESVSVVFRKRIWIRRGEVVDIEAEARNIEFYKFLRFDDTYEVPPNPHFQCCISSRPKPGKLYFINEIEYEPQEESKGTSVCTTRKNQLRFRNK